MHARTYTHSINPCHTMCLSCVQCLGVDVGDRWTKVQECFKPHLDNRALVWYDTHLMMTLAQGSPANESAAKFALAEQLIKVDVVIVA